MNETKQNKTNELTMQMMCRIPVGRGMDVLLQVDSYISISTLYIVPKYLDILVVPLCLNICLPLTLHRTKLFRYPGRTIMSEHMSTSNYTIGFCSLRVADPRFLKKTPYYLVFCICRIAHIITLTLIHFTHQAYLVTLLLDITNIVTLPGTAQYVWT